MRKITIIKSRLTTFDTKIICIIESEIGGKKFYFPYATFVPCSKWGLKFDQNQPMLINKCYGHEKMIF